MLTPNGQPLSELEQVSIGAALEIVPNPFQERTTLHYTLPRSGRMQLLVNSSDGKQVSVLTEGVREAGPHQFAWETARLQPGLYYVTLLLDGQPVVKKAVKLAH